MSTNGFTFANPTYTADNFYQYSAGDLAGERWNHPNRAWQSCPEAGAPRTAIVTPAAAIPEAMAVHTVRRSI